MARELTKREKLAVLKTELERERQPMLPWWTELGQYFSPFRPRFTLTAKTANRRTDRVIDGTGILVVEAFSAGLLSYVSPAESEWFNLTSQDPDLMDDEEVKDWCADSTDRLRTAMVKSNLYQCLPMVYEDLGVFGTAAMAVEDDVDDIFRCHVFPVGLYSLGQSERYVVDTFVRDFNVTLRQAVTRFGKEALSRARRDEYERGDTEQLMGVTHVIYPNTEYRPGNPLAKFKKWAECYFESGTSANTGGVEPTVYSGGAGADNQSFLMESGYDEFPIMAPRWSIAAEDVWGYSPGMHALGDNRQLQAMEKRQIKGLDKMTDPALMGPPSLLNKPISLLPAGFTAVSEDQGGKGGLRPIHEVNLPFEQLELKEDRIRSRIGRFFHEDLFLMLVQDARLQPKTASEIHLRFQEKAQVLGKPLGRITSDLHKPLVNRCFSIMARRGMFKRPPQALVDATTGKGKELKVEFVSVLAQAQRGSSTAAMERFAEFIARMGAVFPAMIGKVDQYQFVDDYGEMTGIRPKVVLANDIAAEREAEKAEAQLAAMQGEQMSMMAGAAKDLSKAETKGDNALTAILGNR